MKHAITHWRVVKQGKRTVQLERVYPFAIDKKGRTCKNPAYKDAPIGGVHIFLKDTFKVAVLKRKRPTAMDMYARIKADYDRTLPARRAAIQGVIDGKLPYDEAKLKHDNRPWLMNFGGTIADWKRIVCAINKERKKRNAAAGITRYAPKQRKHRRSK